MGIIDKSKKIIKIHRSAEECFGIAIASYILVFILSLFTSFFFCLIDLFKDFHVIYHFTGVELIYTGNENSNFIISHYILGFKGLVNIFDSFLYFSIFYVFLGFLNFFFDKVKGINK